MSDERPRIFMGLALASPLLLVGAAALLTPKACASDALASTTFEALDGDTIRAQDGGPSLRLAGIDAPEMPGHCRPSRQCAPGDPLVSRDQLQALLRSGLVSCRVLGLDYYGRRLVRCHVGGQDVGRWMFDMGFADAYRAPPPARR